MAPKVPLPFGIEVGTWMLWGLLPWAILAVLIVGGVLWIRHRDRLASGKGGKPPRSGINIIEGLPGAGKSYWAVKMICESIVSEKRPVYTNLPIKSRVMRQYLRVRVGGRYVGFVQPLTYEHFLRFIERFDQRRVWNEANKGKASKEVIDARFLDQHGMDIITGPDANWIPWGAKICIDEVQSWFHQKDQQNETRALGSFLQHHRHGWYEGWVLTQQPILISKSFRNFNDRTIVCTNMGKRPIVPGVYLPIWMMVYHHYAGDRCRNGVPYGEKPDKIESIIPALGGGHFVRMYQSETLMGGRRQIKRAFDATRTAVLALGEADDSAAIEAARQAKVDQVTSFIKRWVLRVVLVALAVGIGYIWATSGKSTPGETPAAEVVEVVTAADGGATPPTAAIGPGIQTTNTPAVEQRPQLPPPRLTAVGSGWVQLDGQLIELGGVYRDARLVATEDETGMSVWILGRAVLRWRIGQSPVVAAVNAEGL